MKRSRYGDEMSAYALRQAAGGTVAAGICRQMGASEATFCVWKNKYAHLGTSETREPRQLREENAKLKRLVAAELRALGREPEARTPALQARGTANSVEGAPSETRQLALRDTPCGECRATRALEHGLRP